MEKAMEFRVLGPLEIREGDRVVPLRGRRQRSLLAILLLHANRVVPSERLLAELWGEEAPESGVTALHVRVSQLRRALGADGGGSGVIVTRPPGYLLRTEPDRIDSHRFERLLAEGRALSADSEPGRAAQALCDALALWRGPALADFVYEPFAQAEIARLEELRLAALEERIAADLTLGRHPDVVGEIEALVAAYPLRERFREQLMLALYRSGRQADALTVYRDARIALVDKLGIEPGVELRRLEQAILQQDPRVAAPPRAGPPRSELRSDPPEERKVVTVLFADLVGSTELVMAGDPERTRALLETYYDAMAGEIESAGGTVEKFVGDAVMAVFGAPVAQEDHAERALHVALAMRRRMDELFEGRLSLRVGVATGEVVAGKAREGGSFVTGAAVNAGARLEQTAAPGEILVDARTARAAGSAFELGPPVVVEAKGIPEGIECRSLSRALSLTRPRRIGGLERVFVGRESELEVLQATYRRVAGEGRSCLVTVVGEAGVGKTRLVRELWDWLAVQSPEPLRRTGRCFWLGKRITYGPLSEVLREELGLLATDPPDVARRRLGEREILGLALGLDVASDLHPLVARERLRETWTEFVGELTTSRPVVLLVEDLHWAEELLIELLEVAVRDVRGPLMVVATARPELGNRWPTWGQGHRDAATIWLDRLSPAETELLVEQLVGIDLPSALQERLVDRAEGNPFFVEELLASLVDQNVLVRGLAGWELRELPSDLAIPDSVQSVLAARIDLLPPAEKAALQAASVIGRVFWRGAVRELLDDSLPDFSVLESHDFVRPQSTSSMKGERELAFKHALTREVAYAGIPKVRRARLHAAVAGWLERTGEGRDELAPLLAHHYAEAVRPEDVDLAWAREPTELVRLRESALAWLRRAAELAIGRYELDEGLVLLHRALELAESDSAPSELWRAIGRANALKHDGVAYWEAMESAIETCPDKATCAEVYSELAFETCNRWGMWRRRPDLAMVDGWIGRALELAEAGTAARARALVAHVWRNPDEAQAAAEALEIAERLGDPDLLTGAIEAQRVVAFSAADFEHAVAWDRRRFELLPQLTDPDARADILLTAVPSYVGSGQLEQARSIARRHDEMTRSLTPHHRVHGVALLIEVEECAGDWEAVQALEARAGEAIAANADTPCVRNARSLLVCAVANAYLGDERRALELVESANAVGMEQFGHVLDAPRLRLALATADSATAERLLTSMPGITDSWLRHGRAMALQSVATRLDALVFLGRSDQIEEEAPAFVRPGTYLEPFALRALGLVRGDGAMVERALGRFEALGLDWHADQTRARV